MATVPAKSKRQAILEAITEHAPWMPPGYEPEDAAAMQAMAKGTANGAQQIRALTWIIERAADTYGMSYRPGGHEGDRDTVLAEGRRFVGNQIIKLTKVKLGQQARREQ